MSSFKESANWAEPPSIGKYEEKIDERIRQIIEEGVKSVGTDEGTLLYERYLKGEITFQDVYRAVNEDARREVYEEIMEERIRDADIE